MKQARNRNMLRKKEDIGASRKPQEYTHLIYLIYHITLGFPWCGDRIELRMLTSGATATTWNVCQPPRFQMKKS